MSIKVSEVYDGVCSVCKSERRVFSMGDDATFKMLSICRDCVKRLGDEPVEKAVNRLGKKVGLV